MNDPTLSIIANTAAIMDAMFGQKPQHDLPAAPNPEHFADLATWRDAVTEWDRRMELAAGEATVGIYEPTPEQIEAHASYEAALLGMLR